MKLSDKHCVPCEGNVPALSKDQATPLLEEVETWHMVDDIRLEKVFVFKDFNHALKFVNRVGEIAENEGHHPDINLFDYKNVRLTLSTHAIKGLSENDFILASKIDEISR